MTTEKHKENMRKLELIRLKKVITISEAMLLTSLSRSTIHNLRMNNKIKWYKVASGAKSRVPGKDGPAEAKKVLILKQSILDYLESCSNEFSTNKNLLHE